MNLSQRGGGDRLNVEAGEGLRNPHPQLGQHDLLHLLVGEGLHVVLEAGERLGGRDRAKVGPARQDLAQLDVSGSHRLPGHPPTAPARRQCRTRLHFLRDPEGVVHRHLLHQEVGAAVFPEEASQFPYNGLRWVVESFIKLLERRSAARGPGGGRLRSRPMDAAETTFGPSYSPPACSAISPPAKAAGCLPPVPSEPVLIGLPMDSSALPSLDRPNSTGKSFSPGAYGHTAFGPATPSSG